MVKQNANLSKQVTEKKRKTRNNNFVEDQPRTTTSSTVVTENQKSNLKKSKDLTFMNVFKCFDNLRCSFVINFDFLLLPA